MVILYALKSLFQDDGKPEGLLLIRRGKTMLMLNVVPLFPSRGSSDSMAPSDS